MRVCGPYEIPKEEYDKALKEGAESLITNPSDLYGYGVYGAWVKEVNGKYYLTYHTGDTCD